MVLNYLSHCTCINIVYAFTCTGSSLAYIFCLEHNLKAVTTYFLLITKWRSSVNYWPNFAFQSFYKKWKKKRKTTSKLANKERWSILAHICYFPLWSVRAGYTVHGFLYGKQRLGPGTLNIWWPVQIIQVRIVQNPY